MIATRTSRRLLSAYADREPWGLEIDEARSCFEVEETLAWGVHLFRGLVELDGREQAQAPEKLGSGADPLVEMTKLYRDWLDASEFFLERARTFSRAGHSVEGLETFEAVVAEARCLCDALALEESMRPIQELTGQVRPENPRPSRYGD